MLCVLCFRLGWDNTGRGKSDLRALGCSAHKIGEANMFPVSTCSLAIMDERTHSQALMEGLFSREILSREWFNFSYVLSSLRCEFLTRLEHVSFLQNDNRSRRRDGFDLLRVEEQRENQAHLVRPRTANVNTDKATSSCFSSSCCRPETVRLYTNPESCSRFESWQARDTFGSLYTLHVQF